MSKCPFCGGVILQTRVDYPYTESTEVPSVLLKGIEQYNCESCEFSGVSIPAVNQLHELLGLMRLGDGVGAEEAVEIVGGRWQGSSSKT